MKWESLNHVSMQKRKQEDGEKVSYENVRKELKKRNLTDQEIELLFAKYDVDNNRELDKRELERLFQDLKGKKQMLESEIQKEQSNRPATAVSVTGPTLAIRPGIGAGVPPEEMAKIVRRIDRMEYTLTVIVNKIDSVLDGKLILPKNDKKEDENRNTSGI